MVKKSAKEMEMEAFLNSIGFVYDAEQHIWNDEHPAREKIYRIQMWSWNDTSVATIISQRKTQPYNTELYYSVEGLQEALLNDIVARAMDR